MKTQVLLGLLALTLTSCTPAAMEGLGRGLAEGAAQAQASSVKSIGLTCSGTTFGTFTSADATLSLSITSRGEAAGTFTNNGTLFYAEGVVAVRDDGRTLYLSTLNLKLDSQVQGRAAALVGAKPFGLGNTYGSTGTLTGSVGGAGQFTGTFKGLQGSYRTTMTCTGM